MRHGSFAFFFSRLVVMFVFCFCSSLAFCCNKIAAFTVLQNRLDLGVDDDDGGLHRL